MAIKNLLAVVAHAESDAHVLDQAEQLARQHDAFLTVLIVHWLPSLPVPYDGAFIDSGWGDIAEGMRKDLKAQVEMIERRLSSNVDHGAVASLFIERAAARWAVAVRARHADLVLTSRPPRRERHDTYQVLVESALFGSGRPLIVVPEGHGKSALGRRVLIAWDAGRRAARAVGDAMPLLEGADHISVVTIDGEPSAERHGDLPGGEISTHLARHGLKVELRNIASAGRPEAEVLLDEARVVAADLVVMGAYGRSRFEETVFGGMTREILATAECAVFMSR